ncbi:MAG: ABC transporter ATP-binding protein [Thermoprotei archaeon]|nr:MAG: ABC transporter ATP-binding protein [Thermoprotei archaeon]RLF01066.1 MAG: ABC transporter ATP-binding protein [Thermoprotei archaeon]HDI75236.1 ABC transporter ATP-binding protein [Thermoprotei archaeon]
MVSKPDRVLIELRKVSFKYKGATEYAIRDISLRIHEGEFVLVVGPSGCGKTTLCRVFNGLIPNFYEGEFKGKAVVCGYDVAKTPTYILSKYVGMVFQEPENQLFFSTVEKEIVFGLENLGLPSNEIAKRLNEVVEYFKLKPLLKKAPYELSGGEQQKVAIAACIAMRPKVLVLDEPTANLDPMSAKDVIDLVKKLNRERGLTVIIVEHRVELIAPIATRMIVMNRGRIVRDGPVRKVLSCEDLVSKGVAVPKVVEIYFKLKAKNINLRTVPLTPEELKQELLRG